MALYFLPIRSFNTGSGTFILLRWSMQSLFFQIYLRLKLKPLFFRYCLVGLSGIAMKSYQALLSYLSLLAYQVAYIFSC